MELIVQKKIEQFFRNLNVESSVITESLSQFNLLKIKAKTILLHQGAKQHSCFFIVSGILRAVHCSDVGSEFCKEYYFKGELSFLYSSWLKSSHSTYQIDALHDSEVICVPLSLFNRREWLPAKLGLLKQQLLYKEDKEIFLLLKTPEERYLYLLEYWPNWIHNLNNMQLASYIGISPISLSRIKSRIKSK